MNNLNTAATTNEDSQYTQYTQTNRDFAGPLGALTSGYLEFARSAPHVTLRTDPAMRDLYRAHFEGAVPQVQAQESSVIVRYPSSILDWVRYAFVPWNGSAEVLLNESIPWQIRVQGGTVNLDADLSRLVLRSLDLNGGISKATVSLPRCEGTVTVRIGGGVSKVTFHRPAGVAVRMLVHGGASSLTFDERYFGAIGGEVRQESADYASAASRYDIIIAGGASHLTIDTL